ncbi:acetyltransferase [Arachidicoccus ginsenosidimutans]|uniref:GNAT family N-acetyltransferase n=1 Tax=Arachidicoccus sp. BS20 TaxID=1850526 RepID=UPI0007F12A06|nr:GNAT family N-acetyltransferase [Arachidicoccus sp. BS20]ANI87979.1 acetyltransferase [Arachidicoccus sp. BS20]
MDEKIIIRNAEIHDLPYILAIMNDAVLNTTAIYDYYERDMKYVENWFVDMQKKAMPVLACEINGVCVGYGCYSIFRPKDGYRFCVEHSVYVDENFRGKKVGTKLLEALIEKAKEEKYHTMIAGIDAENLSSIAFHRKYGFAEVGYLKEVGYKFDRWLDLVFMEKVL